jgi:hypothetical protein
MSPQLLSGFFSPRLGKNPLGSELAVTRPQCSEGELKSEAWLCQMAGQMI